MAKVQSIEALIKNIDSQLSKLKNLEEKHTKALKELKEKMGKLSYERNDLNRRFCAKWTEPFRQTLAQHFSLDVSDIHNDPENGYYNDFTLTILQDYEVEVEVLSVEALKRELEQVEYNPNDLDFFDNEKVFCIIGLELHAYGNTYTKLIGNNDFYFKYY